MLLVAAVTATGCDMPAPRPAGEPETYMGSWYAVRLPPNAPEGMVCYAWQASAPPSALWGGPVCWVEVGLRRARLPQESR